MKSKFNRYSYLIDGLQTLHNVGLISCYFIPPEPGNRNSFKPRLMPFEGDFGEVDKLLFSTRQDKKSKRSPNSPMRQASVLRSYLSVMAPLLDAIEISPTNRNLNANQLKEKLIGAFLHLEKKYTRTFSSVKTKIKGKSTRLIDHFNETTFAHDHFPLNASNTIAVARGGYFLYRESFRNETDFEKLIWSIAIIGWASQTIAKTRKCMFCPRRTSSGGKYCSEHGQTDLSKVGRTKSMQSSKYRAGKKAYELALEFGLITNPAADKSVNEETLTQQKINSAGTIVNTAVWMAQAIFPAYLTWDVLCDQHIRSVLQHSPLVRELIGDDSIFEHSYAEIIDLIRTKLDLFEMEERALPHAIISLEEWLNCEAVVRPSTRGLGRKACDRLNEAILLAKQCKTRTEIARALNVRQSTVTLWVKNCKELSDELLNSKLESDF